MTATALCEAIDMLKRQIADREFDQQIHDWDIQRVLAVVEMQRASARIYDNYTQLLERLEQRSDIDHAFRDEAWPGISRDLSHEDAIQETKVDHGLQPRSDPGSLSDLATLQMVEFHRCSIDPRRQPESGSDSPTDLVSLQNELHSAPIEEEQLYCRLLPALTPSTAIPSF